VDFCSLKKKLVIELDGSQHLEQEEHDAERTLHLESQGYRVIRFWNDQVMNDMEGVIKTISYAWLWCINRKVGAIHVSGMSAQATL
jgi:very-short-patch-repair endonuclease